MGELKYPQNSDQWAWEKGLKRKCLEHGIDYDPNIGCPECLKKQENEAAEHQRNKRTERKRTWEENTKRVIWPDNKPPIFGVDKKKKKGWKFWTKEA